VAVTSATMSGTPTSANAIRASWSTDVGRRDFFMRLTAAARRPWVAMPPRGRRTHLLQVSTIASSRPRGILCPVVQRFAEPISRGSSCGTGPDYAATGLVVASRRRPDGALAHAQRLLVKPLVVVQAEMVV